MWCRCRTAERREIDVKSNAGGPAILPPLFCGGKGIIIVVDESESAIQTAASTTASVALLTAPRFRNAATGFTNEERP